MRNRPAFSTVQANTMERLDPQMVPVYRRMSSGERVQAGLAATDLVRDRLRAHFAGANPEWSDQEIERAVAARLLRSRDGV
ncbi:MAG: hypothetical protein WD960_01575 [Gemmatimonadota bacterium]